MKRLILGLMALLLCMPLVAQAQELKAAPATTSPDAELKIVWGGGDPKASVYSKDYVPHVIKVLENNRLAGYTWGGVSEGTIMNAEKVTLNATQLAVGQLDILRQLNGQEFTVGSDLKVPQKHKYRFTIIHENIGPECLYAVTKEKAYSTFGHIMANNFDLTVYTGGPKSGSFGTWKILQSVFADLKDIPVEHAGGIDKIVEAVASKSSAFGFFVMRPDPASDVFKKIASAGLKLVPIIDDKLSTTYTYLELKVAAGGLFGGNAQTHTTACTSVALITGDPDGMPKDADKRTVARVKATIARMKEVNPNDLRPNIETWRDMWDSVKVVAADKAADLARQSREALDDILKKEKR